MLQALLDLQENITFVYKDQNLTFGNFSFLNFFGTQSIEEFIEKKGDIAEYFLPKEEYFFHKNKEVFWVNSLKNRYQKDRKVILQDFRTSKEKVFFVTVNQKDELTLVQLTEITSIEKQYLLLKDIYDVLERTNELELAKRLKLERDAIEKERVIIQQAKMAELGEMIGVITHQWKQPLNIISLKSQEIGMRYMMDKLDDEYIKNFNEMMIKQVKFMSKTIDDFRNFFNPNKSKETFSVLDSIHDVFSILEYQFKKNEITVTISGESSCICGVDNEFKQVVLSLLTNAKEVLIAKMKKDRNFFGKIGIAIQTQDDNVCVSIEDNGGGVPQDIIERIFDPYFTTKTQSGGSGIGLHISKTIIEKNFDGNLSVENINDGARFLIQIKRSEVGK